jgi:hypothetical protein
MGSDLNAERRHNMSNNTIKTLKTAKVGDKVSMLTFTGMNLGQFEIAKAGKTKLAITKKNGDVAEFSRETGLQTNANNPKFANRIVDAIPEVEKAPAKKAPAKKAAKKVEPEVEEELDEEVEEEVEEPKKKATKPAAKKAPAKKAPAKKVEKVEIPEDADDFSDEDMDDDFEEFDEE